MMSESSAHQSSPWIYDQDSYEDVLKDIQAVRNLDSEAQKQAWNNKRDLENLKSYEAETTAVRNAFLTESIPVAKEGTLEQIAKALQAIKEQQRPLEDKDHFDQLFAHELELLKKALQQREQKLLQEQATKERQSLTATTLGMKGYLAKYRQTSVYQTQEDSVRANEGDNVVQQERKASPAVKTELLSFDIKEEWQASAEFEAYFDKVAVQEAAIDVRKLKISAEVLEKILFSQENPTTFVWDYLARPDIKATLFAYIDLNSKKKWLEKMQTEPEVTAFFEIYKRFPGYAQTEQKQYLESERKRHEDLITSRDHIYHAAYMLTYLGVDMDLLIQSLEARQKNGSKPFNSVERASVYLFGSERKTGIDWWESIQALDSTHRILTPLTQTGEQRRLNFTNALHLRIGLDTPSKHIDYNTTQEIIETQHAKECLKILEQYHEVRQGFPEGDMSGQLEHYNAENIVIDKLLATFAQHYARLNQALGDVTGRDTSADAPANSFLRTTFMKAGKEQDSSKRLASSAALASRLEKWFTTNKMPHENAFTPKPNNVEERMS